MSRQLEVFVPMSIMFFPWKQLKLGVIMVAMSHAASGQTDSAPMKPGGMMTRDELRNCFKLEKTIETRAKGEIGRAHV